jgi:hypothetical protein
MNKILIIAVVVSLAGSARAADAPKHELPKSKDGNLVVGLCDGQTSVEVEGVKEGSQLSRAQAQAVSDQLMAEWKKKNPNAKWDDETKAKVLAQANTNPRSPRELPPAKMKPSADPIRKGDLGSSGALEVKQELKANLQSAHTYGAFTEKDQAIWDASTQEFVERGNRVFHDAKELGSPIAVSCDMCHPDASNTHPETYPKFQVQLGKVALLRDMINWCVENPVRGKPLADDDERLKAMEAYILAQRKGTPLEYGKH